jgi:hypothetical protein
MKSNVMECPPLIGGTGRGFFLACMHKDRTGQEEEGVLLPS